MYFSFFKILISEETPTVHPPLDIQGTSPHDGSDPHGGGDGKHGHDYGTHVKYHQHDPGYSEQDAKTLRPEPTPFSEEPFSSGPTRYSEVPIGPTPYEETETKSVNPVQFSESSEGPTPYGQTTISNVIEPIPASNPDVGPTAYGENTESKISTLLTTSVTSSIEVQNGKDLNQIIEAQTDVEVGVQTERSIHDVTLTLEKSTNMMEIHTIHTASKNKIHIMIEGPSKQNEYLPQDTATEAPSKLTTDENGDGINTVYPPLDVKGKSKVQNRATRQPTIETPIDTLKLTTVENDGGISTDYPSGDVKSKSKAQNR